MPTSELRECVFPNFPSELIVRVGNIVCGFVVDASQSGRFEMEWNTHTHTHTHNFTTQMFISSTLGSWCLNLTNYRTLEHLFIASIAIAIMLVLCNISIYIYIYIYMVYIYSYRTKVSSEIIQLYHCTSSCLYNTYTHTNLFFVCTLKKYI